MAAQCSLRAPRACAGSARRRPVPRLRSVGMTDPRPARPTVWLPAGVLGNPLLYGSPLEGPALAPAAAGLTSLTASARALGSMDAEGAVHLLALLTGDRGA